VPTNENFQNDFLNNSYRGDIFTETNNNCDNEMHFSSSSDSNEISFICAPYQGNDGGSGDGNSARIDRIFSGWLRLRIKDNKDLVPIIKTVYQWNITKNGKIISIWSKCYSGQLKAKFVIALLMLILFISS